MGHSWVLKDQGPDVVLVSNSLRYVCRKVLFVVVCFNVSNVGILENVWVFFLIKEGAIILLDLIYVLIYSEVLLRVTHSQ